MSFSASARTRSTEDLSRLVELREENPDTLDVVRLILAIQKKTLVIKMDAMMM
jgi:hypothetical protein